MIFFYIAKSSNPSVAPKLSCFVRQTKHECDQAEEELYNDVCVAHSDTKQILEHSNTCGGMTGI